MSQLPHKIHNPPICFVIERLAERSGGAERIVIELANRLARTGRNVHLVSYEKMIGELFYPPAPGVTYLNLRVPAKMRGYPRRALDRMRDLLHAKGPHPKILQESLWQSKRGGFVRALSEYLTLHRPQVVIAVAPPAIVALAQITPTHVFRTIASLHNVPELDLQSLLRWDRNPLDLKRRIQALVGFDAITVLQPSFRDWFQESIRSKVFVVPNPVHPADVTPFAEREKKVLCVGRLAPPKRIHILIEAWARLAPDFPDWTVDIFGVGLLQNALEKRIMTLGLSAQIFLKGETKAIEAEYRRASILAHPAEYEGWGLSVSEALVRGIPALAFKDCAGVNELIANGFNGLLVDENEDAVGHFEQGLRRLLGDASLRQSLGERGPRSMLQFAPEAVQSIWEQVISG